MQLNRRQFLGSAAAAAAFSTLKVVQNGHDTQVKMTF